MVKATNSVLIGALALALSTVARAQQNEILRPKDIIVTHFEELKYPHAAQTAEGVVVVRIKYAKHGQVVEAEALSGNEALVPDSLANVRTWQFRPNTSRTAIVVYNFRISSGVCKTARSFFTFDQPNLVTITACKPATPQSGTPAAAPQAAQIVVNDKDVEVLSFEDLRYPPLAAQARIAGIVVVQAKLDEKGAVVEASAVFGHPMLVPVGLDNVKQWKFRPNAERLAVVVYNFKMACSGDGYNQDLRQFVLELPNLAIATAPLMMVETETSR